MFNVISNASSGVGLDLFECILGRTIDIPSSFVGDIAAAFEQQLAAGRRVVVVAHSQGGIIVSNVVKALVLASSDDAEKRKRLQNLEVYSFCSAADDSLGQNILFAGMFSKMYQAFPPGRSLSVLLLTLMIPTVFVLALVSWLLVHLRAFCRRT